MIREQRGWGSHQRCRRETGLTGSRLEGRRVRGWWPVGWGVIEESPRPAPSSLRGRRECVSYRALEGLSVCGGHYFMFLKVAFTARGARLWRSKNEAERCDPRGCGHSLRVARAVAVGAAVMEDDLISGDGRGSEASCPGRCQCSLPRWEGCGRSSVTAFWLAKVVWVLVATVGAVWGWRSSWVVSVTTVFHIMRLGEIIDLERGYRLGKEGDPHLESWGIPTFRR